MNQDIMSFDELISNVYEMVEIMIKIMTKVKAKDIRLDSRCGNLFINDDCIAVKKSSDRNLQYYGGFEYIDKAERHELGEYVFYSANNNRVQECLTAWKETE